MFPTGNAPFTAPSAQQNANNSMSLAAAALYLHPSLGISNQAYTQFYQQAQGQAQLTQQQQQQQQQLQRQFEQLVVAQAAQNAHAHLQAIQQQQQQQQAFQNQQAQAQNQQKLHAAQQQAQLQQSQAQAVQIQRLNALRQNNQHMSHSHSVRVSTPIVPKSRQEMQAEADARRRRSLIADFMVAPNPTTFLDERSRSDSLSGGIFGEMRRSETMSSEFSVIADETTERKKNSITDHLEAVEKEKKLVDNQITIIQRKKEQYESELAKISSDSADNDKENDDTAEDIDSMSLVERIYAENRKKASRSEAHMPAVLAPSAATIPKYRNPWDSPLVQETIERYKTVKPYLVKMLTERRQSDLLAQKYQIEKYNMMYAEWLKKDERYCKSQKKVARDEKHREIFEKTFPELKKTREERERSGRAGVLSVEQLDQDEEYKRRRAAAVLPPMMMNSRMRNAPFYIDLNGVVMDPLKDHNSHIEYFLGKWTDDEKQVRQIATISANLGERKEQIITYGKNFAAIAEFLDRKSVKDCVLYYYLTKKRQNYKALMGKKRKKPPKCYKPPIMPRLEEVALKAPQDANDITSNGSNTGRILTRLTLDASGYDASSANEIDICVCQKCKAKGIKPKTVTRCQIGTCHNPRRKVKPTRPMPVKWKLITDEQKQFLMHQMLIPEDILKCCPACHKKISKQLDMLIAGELDEEMSLWQKSSAVIWSTEEIKILSAAVSSVGTKDWDAVAEKIGNKYSAKQCREQYGKIHVMESVKKEVESEDDVSEDDRENPQIQQAVSELKNEITEAEPDPSGESSATLSADEAASQDDCVILLPPVAKSPSTHLYKPRFRGTSVPSSEVPILSVDTSHLQLSQIKKESEIKSSPLAYHKSDASACSSSDLSNMDDVAKATAVSLQSTFVGSALLATLTSSTPDSTPARLSTQVEFDRLPQCSISITKSSASTVTPAVSSVLGNIVRGSITQGTPVMRPSSSPTNTDFLLEKVKQMQMLSSGTVATGASLAAAVAAASNIATSSTPPVPTPTLQPNANAAGALPFLQNPLAAAATAFPAATPDPNMSSLAAFYNQLAAMDPTMQYAMTMKIMQQAAQQHEYERRLAALRATSMVDQYRQQALALGLSEQQQQQQQQQMQNSQQQQMNALANDQAKLLLWQQLMQQSTMKPLQQQQQQQHAIAQTVNLQLTAGATPLLAATTPTNVRPAVASHLSGQSTSEQQQQQAKQLIASATVGVAPNMPSRVTTASTDSQRTSMQPLSSTASQLYNDFRNAEQMRKELDENARQLEAQQKLQEEIRYIEQQRRRVVEEEARISDELSRVSQIEYPRALRSQDGEAARIHLQAIERLKERRTAVQHYLRAYDEGLKTLSGRNALASASPSGVIVRSMGDERSTASAGPVSKGAMKEFPPSVTRIGVTLSSTQPVSGPSLIGIKRTLNDSALATAVEARVSGQVVSNDSATPEGSTTNRRSLVDSHIHRKGLDSAMFDSGQTSHMFRTHCHNVFDEEFNRVEHRNMQSSSEIKRKSGIHTVYLPSLSDVHHAPTVKMPTVSQRRVESPTVTTASRFGCATLNNSAPASPHPQPQPLAASAVASISRASPAQQQHYPHFVPTLSQHQARFSPSLSTSTPSTAAASPHGLSATTFQATSILGRPTVSPVSSYSPGVRTPVSALVSPRTPLSINANLPGSHSTHVSPRISSTLRVPTPTTSPFQMSALGTLSPNVSSRSISSSPTFQTSATVSGNTLAPPVPSLLVTCAASVNDDDSRTIVTTAESEEKPNLPENMQRSESAAVASYEPLSPDTSDAVPTSQTDSSTEQATNLPLFSFLNLPDNGNGTLTASTIRPSTSSPDDSLRGISTAGITPPQLTTVAVTTTGSISLPTKPPPQPTYEPLSDDDD
uniref:SANT domain-containing protein n=1 Tax=Setaria digitata TaxID=48799 RepID=A0A915PM23_9BILA